MPEPPTTASTSQSIATSAEDGEGRPAETQSEENDTQTDAIEHERQDSSNYLLSSTGSVGQVQQQKVGEAAEQAQNATEQASEEAQGAARGTAEQAHQAAGEATEQAQSIGGPESQYGVGEDEYLGW